MIQVVKKDLIPSSTSIPSTSFKLSKVEFMSIKCAIYVRVSTKSQDTDNQFYGKLTKTNALTDTTEFDDV